MLQEEWSCMVKYVKEVCGGQVQVKQKCKKTHVKKLKQHLVTT